jgi:hypothetical protein
LSLAAEISGRQRRAKAGGASLLDGFVTALFCGALAALSAQLQGFEFGIDNNVFHIPIVLHWYDLPQFSGDAVMQSLRRYATPVFPFMGLFANDANIGAIFQAAFLLTRALTIFALLRIMRSCGLRNSWLTAATVAAIFVSALYGESVIGRDELLVDIFTHTTLAQALALLGIAGLIHGRLVAAAVATGLAFDCNAMVGLWSLAPLALVCAVRLVAAPRLHAGEILRTVLAFCVTALPIAIWIAASQHFGMVDFDYRAYLRDYYPYHFFVGWAGWPQRIAFALQLASGFIAAFLLPRNRGNAALVLLGLALVFAAGIVVGQTSHSRFLLNLHLLRADGMATWVAIALVLAASFAALASARGLPTLGGIAAVAGLIAGDWRIVFLGLLLLAALSLAAGRAILQSMPLPRQNPALLTIALATFALSAMTQGAYSGRPSLPDPGAVPSDQQLAGAWPRAPEWRQVTDWARTATTPGSLFIVPPKLDFVAARHRNWVGWKEGAAAMWAPDIHAVWSTRTAQVAALRSAPDLLAYACGHGIDYAVFDKRPRRALPGTGALGRAIFSNRWFAVVAVPDCR